MGFVSHIRSTVYCLGNKAGVLEQYEGGYRFCYFRSYLENPEAIPIFVKFPLRTAYFRSRRLFAYFRGLLPEGPRLFDLAHQYRVSVNDLLLLLELYCWRFTAFVCIWPRIGRH